MKLCYWMYAGPSHIGTLRVASSFLRVYAIMHAPLGDDYYNVMRAMLERDRDFTPVTASVVDRHVLARGSQEKVVDTILRKDQEEQPDMILVTPTCTSSILQEDLSNFVSRADDSSGSRVLLADVNHYRFDEFSAGDRVLAQIVRAACPPPASPREMAITRWPSVNIIGPMTLGFHHSHDIRELKRLLDQLDIHVNLVLPDGCSLDNLKNLPRAWCNLVPYREIGPLTATYLEDEHDMPAVAIPPIGLGFTADMLRSLVEALYTTATQVPRTRSPKEMFVHSRTLARWFARLDPERTQLAIDAAQEGMQKPLSDWYRVLGPLAQVVYPRTPAPPIYDKFVTNQVQRICHAAWFSRSIDCQNLTGKRAVVVGDSTHAAGITRILSEDMGIKVVYAATYCTHDREWFTEAVKGTAHTALVTSDHTLIAQLIAEARPDAIFGTQMERHIGKRLGIPCSVISPPVHIQNFPLGYRPFVGYEGANQIADLIYNTFTLGMEDHMLEMFGGHDVQDQDTEPEKGEIEWAPEARTLLRTLPPFVQRRIKSSVEEYAVLHNKASISPKVMYDAKNYYANPKSQESTPTPSSP